MENTISAYQLDNEQYVVPDSETFDSSLSSSYARQRGSSYVSETSSSLLSAQSSSVRTEVTRGEADDDDDDCVPSTCFVPDTQTCVPESLPQGVSSSTESARHSHGSVDFDLSFITDLL